MGRLIEESKVIEILQTSWLNGTVAHRIIDEIEQRIKLGAPTVEAIPKDQYEARLKADMVAMLTDIQLDIEELKTDYDKNLTSEHGIYYAYDKSSRIVQNYINALKESENV